MSTMTDRKRAAEWFKERAKNTPMRGARAMFEMAADSLSEQANGVTANEWISVEDRLPEDREWVLVWHTGYKTPKKAFHKNDLDPYLPIFRLDGDNGIDGEVTHWMPLPNPPKEVL